MIRQIQPAVNIQKDFFLKVRFDLKSEVVKKANELLQNIIKLRTEPQKLGDLKTYGLARRHRSWPANYYETIEKAFSQKNCKDTFFFKYAYDQDNVISDERANLTNAILESLNLHNVALFRRAALTIVESLGHGFTAHCQGVGRSKRDCGC